MPVSGSLFPPDRRYRRGEGSGPNFPPHTPIPTWLPSASEVLHHALVSTAVVQLPPYPDGFPATSSLPPAAFVCLAGRLAVSQAVQLGLIDVSTHTCRLVCVDSVPLLQGSSFSHVCECISSSQSGVQPLDSVLGPAACCGLFQVCVHPMCLPKLFPENGLSQPRTGLVERSHEYRDCSGDCCRSKMFLQ